MREKVSSRRRFFGSQGSSVVWSTLGSLAGGLALLSVTGCPPTPGPTPQPDKQPTAATATIESRSNSAATGTATFEQVADKVKVVVEVSGATPGQHGLHIHETGDCSAPDAKSAGGHFNPGKSEHGAPDKPAHHAGDFGSITVGEDGKGRLELTTDQLSIGSSPNGVIGRAIILHEKPDDMVTQPTGNSGGRIGCGVISAQK